MYRAISRYFGAEPDLDIEAQRAIVVVKEPMSIDWAAVDSLVANASFTLAGIHLRARGEFLEPDSFRFDGSEQRIRHRASDSWSAPPGSTEIAARIEDWKSETPTLSPV